MLTRILRLFPLVLALFALNAHARGGVPLLNHENVAVSDSKGQPASAAQIRAAIATAAASHGWQLSASGASSMVATLHVRGKHSVSTDVDWAAGTFSVKYRDSVNMNYSGNEIHPNYNRWVQQLVNTIRAETTRQ
jgi:hypothetical protein